MLLFLIAQIRSRVPLWGMCARLKACASKTTTTTTTMTTDCFLLQCRHAQWRHKKVSIKNIHYKYKISFFLSGSACWSTCFVVPMYEGIDFLLFCVMFNISMLDSQFFRAVSLPSISIHRFHNTPYANGRKAFFNSYRKMMWGCELIVVAFV